MKRAHAASLLLLLAAPCARAQGIDLSRGGAIEITASQGMEWRQQQQEIIARGAARAVRGTVTVTADQLIAYYRKKTGTAAAPAAPAAPDAMGTGNNEIYRLEALGHVNIYTPTDHATADRAIYDMDQSVLVLTGHNLKITTPQDVLTAKNSMEYWSLRHMAIARGQATVTTNDGRRIYADTLVAYTKPSGKAPGLQDASAAQAKPGADPLAASGKLERVEGFGHVELRTQQEVIRADRGVYVPDTGMARLVGHVHITRGLNQLNGDQAVVDMRTGVSTLSRTPGQRVQGLVVPSDAHRAERGNTPGQRP